MIVPGIVINNGWWIGGGGQGVIKAPLLGTTPTASPPSIEAGPVSGQVESTYFEQAPQWGKTEPRHFILIGGTPAIAGTTIFSNPTVQEWVRGVLGWDEPVGPGGQPLAY